MDTEVTPELKRQRFGWYGYGWASHTFEATVVTVFMSRYLPSVGENAAGGKDGRLSVLGLSIAPGSLFTYTVSLCAILLIVAMPIVGAIADRTGRKRLMLVTFGYLGAASCTAMVFVGDTDWVLGTLLFVAAFLSYSCGKIVYNSILPYLTGPDERDKVSSIGWAAGYIGGGLLLAINFVCSFFITDKAVLARVSLCSAGVWWAIFMLVPLIIMRHLPQTAEGHKPVQGNVLTAGFKELADTFRGLRAVPLTLFFLVAYLVYYDGISTVTTLSAEYGEKELLLEATRC